MSKPKFYITTPIFYVNADPHIGHAYTSIACDAMARHKRLDGYDVFFLTGVDEHGQKVELAAREEGITPQEFVDRLSLRFKEMKQKLNLTNDDFIRTTEERHRKGVQTLYNKSSEKGDVYKGDYEGWYCVPDETFFPEPQLGPNKTCPVCGRPVEKLKEETIFFKLSQYKDWFLKYVQENPSVFQPESRKNEVVQFVKGELRDLSITRSSIKWGIPVPNEPNHVFYVWFDALINYLSAVGYGTDEKRFKEWWGNPETEIVHVVGKEIFRFHSLIWYSMLESAGLRKPSKVFGHGWWTANGQKISKSTGNVIDPFALCEKYGIDAIRYFLLREIPFGVDGDYSEKALIGRFDSDLANDLGNLLNRTLNMLEKYCNAAIPEKPKGEPEIPIQEVINDVKNHFNNLAFNAALSRIWDPVKQGNKYVDQSAPWTHFKQGNLERVGAILYTTLETIRIVAVLLSPVMPETAQKIWYQLGIDEKIAERGYDSIKIWGGLTPGLKTRRGEPLFPRIQTKEIK